MAKARTRNTFWLGEESTGLCGQYGTVKITMSREVTRGGGWDGPRTVELMSP